MTAPGAAAIAAARIRLDGFAIRTPLIRWQEGAGDLWLKLETLQPIGSFKIRGARNAIAEAPDGALRHGVVTASAGNMAQGVAWCARAIGVRCAVVVPDHAPRTKLEAIERLGAQIVAVPFERWWRVLQERRFEGLPGYFVHPVSDPAVIAGNGTIGLELVEDLPAVEEVYVPFGGGGLASGIAAGLRAAGSAARVIAVEPETAAPLTASLAAGAPVAIDYRASFVDGAGGRSVLAEMWPLVQALVAEARTVSLGETAEAVRLLAERARVVAEGAGALALAAARAAAGRGRPAVAIVSGGNIDAARLAAILRGEVPA